MIVSLQCGRAKSDKEACNESVETLANHPDLPFTLVYLFNDNKSWDLITHSGLSPQQLAAFPSNVMVFNEEDNRNRDNETNMMLSKVFSEVSNKGEFPFASMSINASNKSISIGSFVEIQQPTKYFGHLPGGSWTYTPTSAYVIPILSDQNTIAGVLFGLLNNLKSIFIRHLFLIITIQWE